MAVDVEFRPVKVEGTRLRLRLEGLGLKVSGSTVAVAWWGQRGL